MDDRQLVYYPRSRQLQIFFDFVNITVVCTILMIKRLVPVVASLDQIIKIIIVIIIVIINNNNNTFIYTRSNSQLQ